jgi:hypothetical protein
VKPARLVLEGGAERGIVAASLWNPRGDVCTGVAEASPGAEPVDLATAASEAIRKLVADVSGAVPTEVVVALRPPLVQLRTLRGLPAVRSRDLVRLVTEQKERIFRTHSDASIVTAQWLGQEGTVTVAHVALAEPHVLESIEAALKGCHVEVRGFLANSNREDKGLALWTASRLHAHNRARRRTIAGGLVLVVCGWLAPPAAYVADLNRDHHTLEVELTHLDSALARIDSLNVRMSAFAGVAAAFRRQGADSAWASAALAGIALGLPANVHLHAVSLERGGPIRLQVHSNEGPQAKDSVLSRWPGSLIEEGPTSGEFAVELEGGP